MKLLKQILCWAVFTAAVYGIYRLFAWIIATQGVLYIFKMCVPISLIVYATAVNAERKRMKKTEEEQKRKKEEHKK